MYHGFHFCLYAEGHQGCFHILAIVNSAAMNIGVHASLSILVSLECVPRSGIAGPCGSSISSFLKESPHCSAPAFIVCRLFDSSHSDQREMIPHCGYDSHFSDNE